MDRGGSSYPNSLQEVEEPNEKPESRGYSYDGVPGELGQ